MDKTFSTKLDIKVLKMLTAFCRQYHLKKTKLLEELIVEGLKRRAESLEFAESLRRGLEDEREGNFYTAEEVENLIFGKKKAA